MDKKKYLAVIVCVAALAGIIAVVLNLDDNSVLGEETKTTIVQVAQAVTDESGEALTTPEGEIVTEYVTAVEVVSETASETASVSASAKQSTTSSAKTDKSGSKQSSSKKQSDKSSGKNKKKTDKKETETKEEEKVYIDIVLQKNQKAKCSSPNVLLAKGEVTIEKAGNYRITQNTGSDPWHGTISVKLINTEKAELRFENVNISYNKNPIRLINESITTSRSFLESESAAVEDDIKEIADKDLAPNVQLSFPEGTKSNFVSTSNSVTGVLYNESKLTVKGHGSAVFRSEKNADNCICSTKSIKIRNVNLSLSTAQNNNTSTLATNTGAARGIYSYSKVIVESGIVTAKTNGDAIRCDELIIEDGIVNLTSSACDAVDADDAIVINGGTVTAIALQKACFKVRRINNTEKGETDKGVRKGKGDTFDINGGVVIGEGKKISTVQKTSKQPSITCKIVKPSRGTAAAADESKVPAVISIIKKDGKSFKTSANQCTKFLYSNAGITANGNYSATANGISGTIKWYENKDKKKVIGIIDIQSKSNQ